MLVAAHTDIGIKKAVNQDALVVRGMQLTNGLEATLAAVCDGMGGLSNGEIASKEAVNTLSSWFDLELPGLLKDGLTNSLLRDSLTRYIVAADEKLNRFSDENGACGTTLAGIFLYGGRFACINIGDSRVYRINSEGIEQLSHDQTVIQQEMDAGRLTPEEAVRDPRRSVLLQCIGAGCDVVPEYVFGTYEEKDVFLLCSDGFRHRFSKDEMMEAFHPDDLNTEEEMHERIINAIEINKERKERDNISAILIKT